MSAQCNRFVQNAWKKELCSNCFKPREEHVCSEDAFRLNIERASTNLKTDNLKLQGILRGKLACHGDTKKKEKKKKNVAFPESLTEIIGYGGDDFSSDGDDDTGDISYDDEYGDSLCSEDETVPDSEEERALGNLTRANTNFNTVTANLTEEITLNEVKSSTNNTSKVFAPLMLGRIQKDADGRKTTLLVSVTPFGGDESLPTAQRPNDRKINLNGFTNPTKCNISNTRTNENVKTETKNEVNLRCMKKLEIVEQAKQEKQEQQPQPQLPQLQQQIELEKIVDMPLITSTNSIPVMHTNNEIQDSIPGTPSKSIIGKLETKKTTHIFRTPAIKKPENERPKITNVAKTVPNISKTITAEESIVLHVDNNNENKEGIELTLVPLTKNDMEEVAESDRSMILRGRDINKIAVTGADNDKTSSPPLIRKIEGKAATVEVIETAKVFSFEVSRELAGEPDGKADEEESMSKSPPALPRSPPPPIEARSSFPSQQIAKASIIPSTEPRVSFLHRTVNGADQTKIKPAVPQKPLTLPGKSLSQKDVVPSSLSIDPSPVNFTSGTRKISPNANDCASTSPSVQNATNKNVQSAGVSTTIPQDQTPTLQVENSDTKDQDLSLAISENRSNVLTDSTCEKLTQKSDTEMNDSQIIKSPGDSNENSPTYSEEEISESTEQVRTTNKRRMAPKPPASECIHEDLVPASSLFARNPGANMKSDSPVVREKEKRERASSCSPKFRKAVCEVPDPVGSSMVPEASSQANESTSSPRRTISLSQDSLTGAQIEVKEEKKRGRSRFSLKRFLRMGSRKDVDMTYAHTSSNSKNDDIPTTPQPKPRLEIIHPLELDGAAVEVVGNERTANAIGDDQTDASSSPRNSDAGRSPRSPTMSGSLNVAVRPGKPPPPPRNQSLEDWSRLDATNKPTRPPPPRAEVTNKLSSKAKSSPTSWQPSSTTSDSIYANLAAEDVAGEVRSALAPSKPQRTASMRDQAISQPILSRQQHGPTQSQSYEAIAVAVSSLASPSPMSTDSHVYECLSSSPECDSNIDLRHNSGTHSHLPSKRKSDGNATESGATEFKFHHHSFLRSTSLPYCGSETESELYAPYNFYTGDEGPEEDQDWKNKEEDLRINRLRNRRGRSIVHRSLEDNYGAVVVANHEALAQVLEQLNQAPQISANLRGLKNASSLRLRDFHLDTNSSVSIGKRIFYSATWNEQNVTLCIAFDLAVHVSRKEFFLAPIIEFMDSLTDEIAERSRSFGNKELEATVSVFPRLQVSTIQSFGMMTRDGHGHEASTREASFILLQFVNALKSLQARGIEESSRNLSNVVLCREDKDSCYRLYLLQGLNADTDDYEEKVSLCQCALIALQELFLTSKLPLIQELLIREKAVTLSQVKSVLEFSLWGPADLTFNGPREREITLQRWLDLERANVLHALVRTGTSLTVTDEYQLLFLVRTSAKIMCEASILLDEQRNRLARAC